MHGVAIGPAAAPAEAAEHALFDELCELRSLLAVQRAVHLGQRRANGHADLAQGIVVAREDGAEALGIEILLCHDASEIGPRRVQLGPQASNRQLDLLDRADDELLLTRARLQPPEQAIQDTAPPETAAMSVVTTAKPTSSLDHRDETDQTRRAYEESDHGNLRESHRGAPRVNTPGGSDEEALRKRGAVSVLANPNVRRWIAARLAAGIAITAVRATVIWQIYDTTKSAALLGLTGLLAFIPSPFAALWGGLVADAHDRKKIVVGAQLVGLLCAAGVGVLVSLPTFHLALIYAVYVVNGVALAFESPARAAMLSRLVEPEELARAVTVMSTAQAFAFVSGPALAGLLIGWQGARAACAVSAALIAVSLFLVLGVNEQARDAPRTRTAVGFGALREGLSFVLKKREVLGALSIDLFAVIFGGASAMLPIYANDILHVGAHGYGVLAACLDVGALATSVVMVMLPPMRRLGRAIIVSVVAYGAATIMFGFSRTFPMALAAYFLVGVADQVSVVGRSTLVQLSTPDALRGRVSSVNMVFIIASNQLTVAESGFIAELTSPTFAVVSGGVMVFFVTALVALLVPSLWRATTETARAS